MKSIIDDLLYDTEKAQKIFSYRRKVQGPELIWLPGHYYVEWCDADLYKTASGRWFEHNKDKETITPMQEKDVREIISRLDAEKYVEIFGKVEEA